MCVCVCVFIYVLQILYLKLITFFMIELNTYWIAKDRVKGLSSLHTSKYFLSIYQKYIFIKHIKSFSW